MKTIFAILASLVLVGCQHPITVTIPNHFPTNAVFDGTNVIFQRTAARGKMSLPDGSYAPLTKSVSKAIVPRQNPYNVTRSFVASKADPGVLYSTNGTLQGVVLTNAGLFVTAKTIKLINNLPIGRDTLRFRAGAQTLVVLPGQPVMGISFAPWDVGVNFALIDSTNLTQGRVYSLQSTVDLKNWSTITSITWPSNDPEMYWRATRAVPSDSPYGSPFVENYRVVTP